ncbi:MAG: glucosyltransferase domain-containing protein [Deltaproteobacteria bacterium]|nr:glucosyltransferase domain-containing protein [Deltaproteobacteria bacterium]
MAEERRAPTTLPAWALPTALACFITMAFAGLFAAPWASADDYAFLDNALRGQSALALVLKDGRPLLGLFYDLIVAFCQSTADLALFRAVFVALLIVSALSVQRALTPVLGSSPLAAWVALLFATSLPQLDFATLTPSATVPLGYACAAWAFSLTHASSKRAWVGAAALLMVAMTTYTLSAFVFVALTGIACAAAPELKASVRQALHRLLAFGLAALLYAAIFLAALPRLLGLGITERATLSQSPLLKLAALVLPLRDSFDLFVLTRRDFIWEGHKNAAHGQLELGRFVAEAALDPAVLLAALVFLCACASLAWALPDEGKKRRAQRLAVGLAFLPMAYTVNLLLSSFWTPYRTQLALALLVPGYLALGLRALRGRAQGPRAALARATLVAALGFGLAAASVLAMRAHVRDWVVVPLSCEHRSLLSAVGAAGLAPLLQVAPPAPGQTTAPGIRYELGRPASASPWAPVPMVQQARRELGMGPAERVLVVEPGTPGALPIGCLEHPPPAP